MNDLDEVIHKFEKAADDFQSASDKMNPDDPTSVRITLGVAKRVRTASNLLVRALARQRDKSQPTEAQAE